MYDSKKKPHTEVSIYGCITTGYHMCEKIQTFINITKPPIIVILRTLMYPHSQIPHTKKHNWQVSAASCAFWIEISSIES